MTLSEIGILATLITVLIGTPLGILIYQTRSMRTETREFREELKAEIGALDDRVSVIEREKADKRDWVRESLSTRAKIDRVLEGVAELKGKIDSEFGVAAAINRVAERMAEKQS